jgi:hypothetical protein
MADRYEPKLTVRPLSERKPALSPEAENDPLVELTRMVSGRSTFDPPPAPKAKTVPAASANTSGDAGLATDLESELLNDLQASFAMLRETAAKPTPAPTPLPPEPVMKAPPSATVAAPPRAPVAPAGAAPNVRVASAPPTAPAPSASNAARPAAPAVAPPPVARESRLERALGGGSRNAPLSGPETLGDRTSFFRSGNGPTVDLSQFQLRPTVAPPKAAEPPAREVDAGQRAAERPSATVSRFAPPRSRHDIPPVEPEPSPEQDDFPDPAATTELDLGDLPGLPEYTDDAELPPFPDDELSGLSRRRTNRTIMAIGAVVVIALAGALGYFMLSDRGSAAAPPVITADTTPTKIIPPTPDADVAKSDDRVDGPETADSKLVTTDETKVAALPSDAEDNNPISRVIIPAGPGFDSPVADGGTAADDSSQLGPKKVRTVVVRPDGTIVSSEAVPADGSVSPPPSAAADATPAPADDVTPPADATASPQVATAETPPATDEAAPADQSDEIAVNNDPLAIGKPPTVTPDDGSMPAAGPVTTGPVATGNDDGSMPAVGPVTTTPEPTPAAQAMVTPPIKPAKVPKPKPVAVASTGPIDITPDNPAPPAMKIPAGAALVQLSSQKSEEAALSAYKGLQRRFPGILASYHANIQRADLGDRGIYYRVRVGPFSAADADRLCQDLKAAGGDCLIAH